MPERGWARTVLALRHVARPAPLGGRKRLPRLGLAREGRATAFRHGVACFVTLLAPRRVGDAVRLRSAGLRGDADPPLRTPAGGRGQLVRAIAGGERCQGRRISVGQDGGRGVHGRRGPRAPLHGCLGQLLAVGCTIEGAIRHQRGPAIGGLQLLHMGANRLAKVLRITAGAMERLQQERNARLLRRAALHQDVVEVRPVIPAVPSGNGHALFLRLLVAVVRRLDLQARALERGKAGRKAQARGRGSGHEAVAFGAPRGLERLQGPSEGAIVELCGGNTGRNEAGGGLLLGNPGDAAERWIDNPPGP